MIDESTGRVFLSGPLHGVSFDDKKVKPEDHQKAIDFHQKEIDSNDGNAGTKLYHTCRVDAHKTELKMIKPLNMFSRVKGMMESSYDSGVGYTARVVKTKDGKPVARFFKDGKHMQSSDYEGEDEKDAHEFAQEEMEFRKKEASKNEEVVQERILEPQGHQESPDPISKDSAHQGRVKKQMGNRTPLEIIAKILAGVNKE